MSIRSMRQPNSRVENPAARGRLPVCSSRWTMGSGTWLVMVAPARRRNSSVPTAAQGFPFALVARERDRALVRRVRGVAGPPQELGPHGV
jgi:hypothetical protein